MNNTLKVGSHDPIIMWNFLECDGKFRYSHDPIIMLNFFECDGKFRYSHDPIYSSSYFAMNLKETGQYFA